MGFVASIGLMLEGTGGSARKWRKPAIYRHILRLIYTERRRNQADRACKCARARRNRLTPANGSRSVNRAARHERN
jgi:hypothetical protein